MGFNDKKNQEIKNKIFVNDYFEVIWVEAMSFIESFEN